MMIPTPYPIGHIARYEDTTADTDEHGNYPVTADPPVIRWIYSYSQFGRRGSSRTVQGPEFQDRTDTVIHLAVPDPTVFAAGDQILLNPQLDAHGDYVDGTGTAYWVDGDPADEEPSPWPRYTAQTGGVIKTRRVT